jgi:hypothetical protein
MKWDQVKNWVFGGGGAVALILLMGFVDWRIGVKIDEALASQDLATDSNIMAISASVADNKRTGEENAEDIEQNRERVEAAFSALLGRNE